MNLIASRASRLSAIESAVVEKIHILDLYGGEGLEVQSRAGEETPPCHGVLSR